ncbi:MAG: ATP-binding cassette domain-containing protein, partial [Deltaproteobacteria bacterium]|nr:ATP-binding cassette domain-containing protein [Deltaproteobacteria bacterium]
DLVKEYRTTRKREGLRGALVDLVRPRKESKRAIESISFSIAEGERVGYIGANGAGKSTTIKVLTGILKPTSGYVRVAGFEPLEERRHYVHQIGVVFGQRTQLWWDIAVIEAFRLLARIYGVTDAELKARLAEFTEVLDLEPLLHTPVRKLSLGQRMRCDLAASLLHQPRILFLDEPTIGLDVDVKDRVRSFIRAVNERHGTTVLLTTHDLRDIEELCERVLLIDEGRVLFDGALGEFKRRFARERRVVLDLPRRGPRHRDREPGQPAGDGRRGERGLAGGAALRSRSDRAGGGGGAGAHRTADRRSLRPGARPRRRGARRLPRPAAPPGEQRRRRGERAMSATAATTVGAIRRGPRTGLLPYVDVFRLGFVETSPTARRSGCGWCWCRSPPRSSTTSSRRSMRPAPR